MTSPGADVRESRRRFTDDAGEFSSVIGAKTTAEATLTGTTDLELCGRFEGEITLEGLVWIRPGGRFKGTLAATRLVVEGELEGTATVTDKVDLRATSRVHADITATTIVAAEGSFFEGKIVMSGSRQDVVTYREKRAAPPEKAPG